MNKRIAIILCALIGFVIPAASQVHNRAEAYITTDLTSAYLWRGQRIAGICIQPVMGLKWRGLNFFFWGNAQLTPPASENPPKHEIDIFLKYQLTKRFNIALKDVYMSNRGTGFFDWNGVSASHGVELLLNYQWFKHLTTEWSTQFLGADGVTKHGHRSYSSYLLLTSPFTFCHINWDVNIGIVPYYTSRYDDNSTGFHVNNVALRGAYDFKISESGFTQLSLYTQLMVNPSNEKAYFQVGCKFALNPARKSQAQQ